MKVRHIRHIIVQTIGTASTHSSGINVANIPLTQSQGGSDSMVLVCNLRILSWDIITFNLRSKDRDF